MRAMEYDELSDDRAGSLREEGFCVFKGVVSDDASGAARRAIYSALDRDGLDPAWLDVYRRESFAPQLRRDPRILGVLGGASATRALDGLFGAGRLRTEDPAAIRLEFPSLPSDRDPHVVPILDGWIRPSRQFPEGDLINYTALAVAQLTDATAGDDGGIVVWPGAHTAMMSFIQEHGARSLRSGFPNIALPEPRRIPLRRGDLAVVHYLTPRALAPNQGAQINTSIHFRLHNVDHYSTFWNSGLHWSAITDPWKEWPGVVG